MTSLVDLWRGIHHHPWKTVQYVFTNFSVIFTLVRATTYFLPAIKIEGWLALTAAVVISIVFGLRKVWKPSRIEISVAHCNTIIEVVFGDLFKQDGIRAIAVNEFFDSKLGKPVSDKSIHGIFIQKCFGGHPESFDKQVDEQLGNIQSEEIAKVEGKSKRYPIGSTALITVNQDRYLAFAFAKTDPNTCKASSDVRIMWMALHELWKRARIESGGYPVNLPLVGSGLSGIGLPTRTLLDLIILSAITETKEKEVTQKIRIVLHRDRFDALDLRDVKQHWKEQRMAYRSGTYVAFHAAGTNLPGESDMDYYNLMKAWTAKTDDEFTMVNSHEKASAVRDSSLRTTLRNSLLERLRNSKNMVLIIGETTCMDTDWVPFEIEQAVDTYKIPIIAAYTVWDKPIRNPVALVRYWPISLSVRINNGTANVIHIPFKKEALKDAIRFSHDDPPPGKGLAFYNDKAYRAFGIEG